MKLKILLLSLILGIVAAFFLFGTASATESVEVMPRVNVVSGGSLSIVSGTTGPDNNIDFGDLGPGDNTTKTLTLGITANAPWSLTVSKTQDLKCSTVGQPGYGQIIPSANFTFNSSGPAGPTTDTEFGADTPVVNGPAISDCNVNVIYRLEIPDAQPAGTYNDRHTYTLIVP